MRSSPKLAWASRRAAASASANSSALCTCAHALAAAAGNGFEQHRVAHASACARSTAVGLVIAVVAGNQGHAGLAMMALARALEPMASMAVGGGPMKTTPRRRRRRRRPRSPTGIRSPGGSPRRRVRARPRGCVRRADRIRWPGASDMYRLVGQGDVQCVAVRIGVDGDGPDAEAARRGGSRGRRFRRGWRSECGRTSGQFSSRPLASAPSGFALLEKALRPSWPSADTRMSAMRALVSSISASVIGRWVTSRTSCLAAATWAAGPFFSSCRRVPRYAVRPAPPHRQISLSRPRRRAVCASKRFAAQEQTPRPARPIASTTCGLSWRESGRCAPPSGRSCRAVPMAMSQQQIRPTAPPKAAPCTRAIVGWGRKFRVCSMFARARASARLSSRSRSPPCAASSCQVAAGGEAPPAPGEYDHAYAVVVSRRASKASWRPAIIASSKALCLSRSVEGDGEPRRAHRRCRTKSLKRFVGHVAPDAPTCGTRRSAIPGSAR
jgi:hypothetical protein